MNCPQCGIGVEQKVTEAIFGNLYAITVFKCGLQKRDVIRWKDNSCATEFVGKCSFSGGRTWDRSASSS